VGEVHIAEAREALVEALGECPLPAEALRRPSFAALMTVLIRLATRGFARDLFSDHDLSMGSTADTKAKKWLLARLFALVGALTGERVALKPGDILKGRSPVETLHFIAELSRLAATSPPPIVEAAIASVQSALERPRAVPPPPETAVPAESAGPPSPMMRSLVDESSMGGFYPGDSFDEGGQPSTVQSGTMDPAAMASASVAERALPKRKKKAKKKKVATVSRPHLASSAPSSPIRGSTVTLATTQSVGAPRPSFPIPPPVERAIALGGRNVFDGDWLSKFDFRVRSISRQMQVQKYGRVLPASEAALDATSPLLDPPPRLPEATPIASSGVGGLLSPGQLREAQTLATGGGQSAGLA
jgi:hypothetical protein